MGLPPPPPHFLFTRRRPLIRILLAINIDA
jgi:hypothetical protein